MIDSCSEEDYDSKNVKTQQLVVAVRTCGDIFTQYLWNSFTLTTPMMIVRQTGLDELLSSSLLGIKGEHEF